MESTLPPPSLPSHTAPVDLRKAAGTDTPFSVLAPPPKQLYQVLEQKQATVASGEVFASEVAYALPTAAPVPEGAESVLSKAVVGTASAATATDLNSKRKRKNDADEEDDEAGLGKNFKF